MKSLQLCIKLPFPLIDGGTMGFHHLTELLSEDEGDELHIIAFDTDKQKGVVEKVPQEYIKKHQAQYPHISLSIKPWQAFLNLFSDKSLNIIRFDQRQIHDLIREQLIKHEYDVVFIETLFMMPYFETITQYHKGKIVFRSHNVEYQIWQSLTADEKNPIKKWYLNLLTKRLKAYELNHSFLAHGGTSVSLADIDFYHSIRKNFPFLFLPYSFRSFVPVRSAYPSKPSFYFIGGMDWEPNLKAVKFIEEELVPLLEANNFEGKIWIGGRRMPQSWQSKPDDIIQYVGEIDSLDVFLSRQHVLISPLFTGGGLKIKIVEALAKGINVITNLDGVVSLPSRPDEIVFVANNATQFADQILDIYNNPDLLLAKQEAITKMMQDYFLFENNKRKLKEFIMTL
jgi:polysaccharide biosynthesis protein PslH